MDRLKIVGGKRLKGEIKISGSKNSGLAIMAGSILCDKPIKLYNVPHIQDVNSMILLINDIGGQCIFDNDTIFIDNSQINKRIAECDFVKKMRASVLLLGSLLGRFGEAKVSLPGGCPIGVRAIDQHIEAMKALGADIKIENGYIIAKASKNGLKGNIFTFKHNSVGATENAINCAVLTEGTTIFKNCAKEPEIVYLCNFLNSIGAKIKGQGTDTITVEGVEKLNGGNFEIPEDRIEAGTYAIASAITDGDIILKQCNIKTFESVFDKFNEIGIGLEEIDNGKGEKDIRAFKLHDFCATKIETAIYPGFPTDLQAQIMIPLILCNGTSVVLENIFENRLMHCPELCRMGASIEVRGTTAIIQGGKQLHGANVMSKDLRASASLVLAGLIADGTTIVDGLHHLDRGFDKLEEKLKNCGADIERI